MCVYPDRETDMDLSYTRSTARTVITATVEGRGQFFRLHGGEQGERITLTVMRQVGVRAGERVMDIVQTVPFTTIEKLVAYVNEAADRYEAAGLTVTR